VSATNEQSQYGDKAKGFTEWATCGRCGVKDRVPEMAPGVVDGVTKYVHRTDHARCAEWKRQREEAR